MTSGSAGRRTPFGLRAPQASFREVLGFCQATIDTFPVSDGLDRFQRLGQRLQSVRFFS
jgi:hypothetical protein